MEENVNYVEREKFIEYTKQHPLVLVHWYASVFLFYLYL